MLNWNDPERIEKWAENALSGADTLSEGERTRLLSIARKMVSEGYWRGNISDAWRREGYGPAHIPDIYP